MVKLQFAQRPYQPEVARGVAGESIQPLEVFVVISLDEIDYFARPGDDGIDRGGIVFPRK